MLKLRLIYLFMVLSMSLLNAGKAKAQITTYTVQGFNFGDFYQGASGGTISLSTDGVRTATGDIVLINNWQPLSQAIFEITAPTGLSISILMGTDSTLSGSKGGSMTLHLEGTDVISPFSPTAVAPDRTRIKVAGKLTVGSRVSSPPGIYEGSCSIIFNQE